MQRVPTSLPVRAGSMPRRAGSMPLFAALRRQLSRRARAATALVLTAAATGCDSSRRVIAPEEVASVDITAQATALVIGETTTMLAMPRDAAGRPLPTRPVQWSSSDDAVATVSAVGQVTAVGRGAARIAATSEGKRNDVAIEVALPPVASVTLGSNRAVLNPGDVHYFIATPRDAYGVPIEGLTVEWSVVGGSSAVALSSTGVATALQRGTATIRATVGTHYAEATVTVLGTSTHDLLFERSAPVVGNVVAPWLHRVDTRVPGAVPTLVRGPFDASPHVAPSPNGRRIAYVCSNNGSAICVAMADGSNGVLLPGFGGNGANALLADQPAWSPDGSRIAFRGWAPGGPPGIFNPADIWVMNADGSNKVRLSSAQREVDAYESPTWSPQRADGSYRIAFVRETRGDDGYMRATIQSIRADGQDRLPVTAPGPYVDGDPTWSPDGTTIAFVRTGGAAAGDIWLVNAGSGHERPLMSPAVEPAGAQRAPAWSPDGGLIAFASDHEVLGNFYTYQIYTVRVDGTQVVRHTSDTGEKGNPAWVRR